MKETKPKNNRGFTLIELLVVVAILGVLSSLILISVKLTRTKGEDVNQIKTVQSIQKALTFYYDKNGAYPSSGMSYVGNLYSTNTAVANQASWNSFMGQLSPWISNIDASKRRTFATHLISYGYNPPTSGVNVYLGPAGTGVCLFPGSYVIYGWLKDGKNTLRTTVVTFTLPGGFFGTYLDPGVFAVADGNYRKGACP